MATKVKFAIVPKPERAAKSATAKATKPVDPVIEGLPPIDSYLPGDVIRDPESGRRFSLRPAKSCTRCGGMHSPGPLGRDEPAGQRPGRRGVGAS